MLVKKFTQHNYFNPISAGPFRGSLELGGFWEPPPISDLFLNRLSYDNETWYTWDKAEEQNNEKRFP